jgi:rhamnosyltransferase
MLSETAAAVTGLDIDDDALRWAQDHHRNARLSFRRDDDLGASLPDASFDLVTCFEMIEHVDHATQQAAVANMARLLREDGVLVISTPNPEVTALYGVNPYHIREMDQADLHDLLSAHFAHIDILRQYVRVGVVLDRARGDTRLRPGYIDDGVHTVKPLAFLAVCGNTHTPRLPNRILFDPGTDYVAEYVRKESSLYQQRATAHENTVLAHNLRDQLGQAVSALEETQAERRRVERTLEETTVAFTTQLRDAGARIDDLTGQLHHLRLELDALHGRRHGALASSRFLAHRLAAATRARAGAAIRNRLQPLASAAQDPQLWGGPHTDSSASPDDQEELPPPRDYACTLVIPTKNGGALFKRVVQEFQKQSHWQDVEFIVVDSGSTDDTVAVARAAGAKCWTVAPADFDHGATRDLAIAQASHNRVILTVQDAVPSDGHLIARLLAALDQDGVAGVYAHQIPRPDADVITKRNLHIHLTGRRKRHVTRITDHAAYSEMSPMQKYALCNFDNVCAAIRKDVWEQEPFGPCEFGEDIDWAQRALKRGFKIVYEPTAAVVHSHDRPMGYEYKRTYVCHRKLYSLFGVAVTPTLTTALQGWLHSTLRDALYIARTEKRWPAKLGLISKAPALNFLRVLAQYRAVRDESTGTARAVQGI